MTRIAIIVHVFYPTLWTELSLCIHNFDKHLPDIYITLPILAEASLVATIQSDFPKAKIFKTENRGYDIGPFFFVLGALNLSDYDYVVKIHTKRNRIGFVNYLPLIRGVWRHKLLGFCATQARAEKSLAILEENQSVGMVAHGELIMSTADEMDRRPLNTRDQIFDFVAGTMFIVRAKILIALKESIHFEDFPPMAGRAFGLAHECERIFGKAVSQQGFRIAENPNRTIFFNLAFRIAKSAYSVLCRR